METIKGVVKKLVFASQKDDFKIFTLVRKDRSVLSITGQFPNIVPGTKLELHGSYKQHPKYGVNFKADAYSFDFDKNPRSICRYIMSIAKWIGPEKSMDIAERFGADLERVIEETPERLLEVEGVGEKAAESLAEAWRLNRDMKGIRIFLHELGLSLGRIKKIITMFGSDTEEILKDDPWILCMHGFGFSTCDSMADKLDKDMSCAQRYRAFILYTLGRTLSAGHLFLKPGQILSEFNKFNRKSDYPFKKGEITVYDIAPHVKKLIEDAYIVNDENRVYGLENFFYENESARILSRVSQREDNCKLENFDIENFIKRYEKQHKIELSDAQHDAIRSFVKEKVMVITGSPGTGKTTVSKALVQILKEKKISFELLTPTGIAAKKLGNTAGTEAYTIHRRLGYRGSEWTYNADNKYITQVVICDESSMIDQEVFYRLVSALHPSTKLVFVGDNDQLPSVGPGSILKELIGCEKFKSVFLNVIFRQEDCSDIIKEAKKIRDGDTDLTLFKQDKQADIWHIVEKDVHKIEKTIVSFSKQLKSTVKGKNDVNFQIITPRNQGPLSVETLNNLLQAVLNPPDKDKKETKLGGITIRKGDRIIIRKNNYDLNVFNGDIGKVVSIAPDRLTVDVEDAFDKSRRVEVPINVADEMVRLAYAITVHKCVPEGTQVQTARGSIPIEQVVKGDTVLTHAGNWKRVSWSGYVGRKRSRTIRMKSGDIVRSSGEHRWYVRRGKTYQFIQASEIIPGDFLCRPAYFMDWDHKQSIEMDEIKDRCMFVHEVVVGNCVHQMEQMYDLTVEGDNSYLASGFFCHNSQGMEYSMVILPFVKEHGRLLLQRNLLYTAVTRAKKKVIVLGQASAVERAIMNDKIQRRNTMFAERIKLWMEGKGTSLRDLFSKSVLYQNAKTLDRLLSLERKS